MRYTYKQFIDPETLIMGWDLGWVDLSREQDSVRRRTERERQSGPTGGREQDAIIMIKAGERGKYMYMLSIIIIYVLPQEFCQMHDINS